jgi:hypothetical protein
MKQFFSVGGAGKLVILRLLLPLLSWTLYSSWFCPFDHFFWFWFSLDSFWLWGFVRRRVFLVVDIDDVKCVQFSVMLLFSFAFWLFHFSVEVRRFGQFLVNSGPFPTICNVVKFNLVDGFLPGRSNSDDIFVCLDRLRANCQSLDL